MIKFENGGIGIEFPKDSRRISSIIRYINKHQISHISIKGDFTCSFDLDFLNGIANPDNIKELRLYGDFKDYSSIYRFENVVKLSTNLKGESLIDLCKFKHLLELSTCKLLTFFNLNKSNVKALHYGNAIGRLKCESNLIVQLAQLEDLRISNTKDFTIGMFNNLKKLRLLWLTQCDIENFRDIKYFVDLEFIAIHYCNKFVQIDELDELPKLKYLWLENCSKLNNVTVVENIKNLKVLIMKSLKVKNFSFLKHMECQSTLNCLMLDNCGSLESIKFLDDYFNLQAFSCRQTNVLDGDLTPCLRLESARTSDKRHYNLKEKQLPFGRAFYEWLRLE